MLPIACDETCFMHRADQVTEMLEMGSGLVFSVSFSGCGEYVASGSRDNTVRIWSSKDGTCQKVLEGHRYSSSQFWRATVALTRKVSCRCNGHRLRPVRGQRHSVTITNTGSQYEIFALVKIPCAFRMMILTCAR